MCYKKETLDYGNCLEVTRLENKINHPERTENGLNIF